MAMLGRMTNLLRTIALGLLIWIAFVLVRNYLSARSAPRAKRPPRIGSMVRCARCGLHVLEGEAVRQGDAYYCSVEHRDKLGSH